MSTKTSQIMSGLLVAAHEADHAPAGGVLDDGLEALAHDLLKRHPLLDDGAAAPPSSSVCSTRVKPPRSRQTTRSSW
jgi:hypothetical protein